MPRTQWEAAVFDLASHFNVIRYDKRPFKTIAFATFAEAMAYAERTPGTCLYAISPEGRSVLLDRQKWHEWAEREKITRLSGRNASSDHQKPTE